MDIRLLVEKFFDASTTVDEERELYRFLCENDVPADMQQDKKAILALMQYPEEGQTPKDLAFRLEHVIDAACERERKVFKIPKMVWTAVAAAACIALVVIPLAGQQSKDTFTTPEDAAYYINDSFACLAMTLKSCEAGQQSIGEQLVSFGASTRHCFDDISLNSF